MKNRANPENCRELNKKYLASEKGKAARYRATVRYRENHRKKLLAHNAVAYALRIGKLEKWPCQVCGCEESQAHHADYDNLLGVVWLCDPHHKDVHKMTREHK